MAIKEHERVETIIRGLIDKGCDPRALFVGLHNAFVHGEILIQNGYEITDKQLGKFYKGIKKCSKVLDKVCSK